MRGVCIWMWEFVENIKAEKRKVDAHLRWRFVRNRAIKEMNK